MATATSLAAPPLPVQLRPLIDEALERFLPAANVQPEPLHRAMRYAVFAGGKRMRPQFLLKVAQSCGVQKLEFDLALRAACAVELIHIASLVHDDLPCFDNAAWRRGQPTIHVLFGEARALLVGDALMALGFELLAGAPRSLAARTVRLVQLLARATGSSSGLVGGQGLEQENAAGLRPAGSAENYHAKKTGALFGMAAQAAAVSAGLPSAEAWAHVGWLVGRGYQLAHALMALSLAQPALAGSSEPLAASCSNSPAAPYAEFLKAQLRALSSTLHQRIYGLAAAPKPLLEFLDELSDSLLQSQNQPIVAPAPVL